MSRQKVALPNVNKRKFHVRPGLVGVKIGMTSFFDESGKVVPVTLVKALDCKVLTKKQDGYSAYLVAYGQGKKKSVSKSMQGVYKQYGTDVALGVMEFRLNDHHQELGQGYEIKPDCFGVGDYLDVYGRTKGKGFAGAMKRHNFAGLEASHGVSISHRSHGSTGNRQDPGRVFKNKKMAGHMGCTDITVKNIQVVHLDNDHGVLFLRGCVPGNTGDLLTLVDAERKTRFMS